MLLWITSNIASSDGGDPTTRQDGLTLATIAPITTAPTGPPVSGTWQADNFSFSNQTSGSYYVKAAPLNSVESGWAMYILAGGILGAPPVTPVAFFFDDDPQMQGAPFMFLEGLDPANPTANGAGSFRRDLNHTLSSSWNVGWSTNFQSGGGGN